MSLIPDILLITLEGHLVLSDLYLGIYAIKNNYMYCKFRMGSKYLWYMRKILKQNWTKYLLQLLIIQRNLLYFVI